jgi:hypothetical protein
LKPTVVANELPADCPIINANPDTLISKLRKLLSDTTQLHAIGTRSREFALKYHDVKQALPTLINAYNEVIEMNQASCDIIIQFFQHRPSHTWL